MSKLSTAVTATAAVGATVAVTTAIISAAPYVAGGLVLSALGWLLCQKEANPEEIEEIEDPRKPKS